MKHSIVGMTMPVPPSQPDSGEKIIVEPGAVSSMTENIQLHTTTLTAAARGLFGILGRASSPANFPTTSSNGEQNREVCV